MLYQMGMENLVPNCIENYASKSRWRTSAGPLFQNMLVLDLDICKGFGVQRMNHWFIQPIALASTAVFLVDDNFCKEVEKCKSN